MQAMARRAQQGQMMQGNPMERQGSQMDRSGSPGSGGHPSPKRPRVEGGMNNMQMPGQQPQRPGQIPNNQVGPLPNQPPLDPEAAARTRDLMIQRNVDPNAISPVSFHTLAMQPTNYQIKSLDSYNASMQATMKNALNQAQASSNMNKGMPPNSAAAAAAIQAGAQGSPMPQAMDGMMFDGGANGMMRGPTMVPNQQVAAAAAAMGNQGGQNGSGGSHALQDYQMQLMLLEQQNKRRLMMARQEQDGMSSHTGVPASNGQFAPNLSPGQANPSPNPNDMQRGTPKMNNGPSPNGNLAGRGSPAPGGQFDPNMPPVMRNQMMMGPNGPRSNPQMTQAQLEMMRQQGMMSNGNFQMNPGMQPNMMQGQHPGQGQPGQVAPNMTPRQGNNPMPPPPAPQQNATGNTQPSSPAPTAAPPTPSQTAKTKPGAKKDNKVGKVRRVDHVNFMMLIRVQAGNKKNAAAATPASESEQPPTPGSQAPVTPMHAKMNGPAGVANGGQANGMPGMGQPGDLGGFNMDPTNSFVMGDFTMDTGTGDVLENFDFDAFLNNSDGDGTLAFSVGDDFNFDPVAGVDGTDLQ